MNAQHISTQLRAALGRDLDQSGAAEPLAQASLGLVGANGDLMLTGESLRPAATITLAASADTFRITSSIMTIAGDAGGNTVDLITGGAAGKFLVLFFLDSNVTITDEAATTADSVNLSAAFTGTANDILTLYHNGTKWFEVSRSVN